MCHDEPRRRRIALAVLGLMMIVFAALSVFSFTGSRKQALPQDVTFERFSAVDGKRVFQAYNCMGCHTIVGNGAYFGPDLTDLYRRAGPAWLAAFLPSAGAWPTAGAIRVQLQNPAIAEAAGTDSFDAYLERYPAARERIEHRGGRSTFMPNLPFTRDEIGQLIAFLKYTSAMNTEGWPPKPRVDGLAFAQATPMPAARAAAAVATVAAATSAVPEPASAARRGAELAQATGCMACHSKGTDRLVGPGWGGLYDSAVSFADGSSARADDAYLSESIVDPDARVVKDFVPHVMPAYVGVLDASQVADIVAYIRSLRGAQP